MYKRSEKHTTLFNFYDATSEEDLIDKMSDHIDRVVEKLKNYEKEDPQYKRFIEEMNGRVRKVRC